MTEELSKSGDRPAIDECEIEVTSAMIDAGHDELQKGYFGDGRYDLTCDRLAAIYRAMNAARLL